VLIDACVRGTAPMDGRSCVEREYHTSTASLTQPHAKTALVLGFRFRSHPHAGGRTARHHATSPLLTSPHARPLVSALYAHAAPASFPKPLSATAVEPLPTSHVPCLFTCNYFFHARLNDIDTCILRVYGRRCPRWHCQCITCMLTRSDQTFALPSTAPTVAPTAGWRWSTPKLAEALLAIEA
jgi:hypothetical protein